MPRATEKRCEAIVRKSCGILWLNKNNRLAALVTALLLCVSLDITADESLVSDQVTIDEIIVNRVNIFAPEQARSLAVYQVANLLHRTTREDTILRELGVVPGDMVSAEDIAEFERLLRRTDLFSTVSVTLQTSGNEDGAVQLHINTRDRLSIVAGASGSFLGGVGEVGVTLGERNLAGLGDSLLFTFTSDSDDEVRGTLSYNDLHFINKDQRALYQIGRTEEGDFYRVRFQRPFKNRLDKNAWSILAESVGSDIDFFERGVSVVQVPLQREALDLSRVWRSGTERRSVRRGLTFQLSEEDYEPSRGVQADTIEAPFDSTQIFAGFLIARDTVSEYRQVRSLDTLKFTQDLTLGSVAELQFGFIHTDYNNAATGHGAALSPRITARLGRSFAAGDDTLLRLSLVGSATFEDINGAEDPVNDNEPWSFTAAARWYNTRFKSHTFASRLDYTVAETGTSLPAQFTLGENNGLRGYDRRLLSGRERLRFNFEDRLDLDWRLGVLDIGLVGFFDLGWVAEDDGSDELKRSAGFGLRFGSNVVLGAGVIRMDVAFPFDDEEGSNAPTLSISVGQVFRF